MGEVSCHCRRETAAGAVHLVGILRGLQHHLRVGADQDIHGFVAGKVAAGHHDIVRAEVEDGSSCFLHLGDGGDVFHTGEDEGFGDVGSDDCCPGKEGAEEDGGCVFVEEAAAARCHHDRVEDERDAGGDDLRNGPDHPGRAEHAGLDGTDGEVLEDGLDLEGDDGFGDHRDPEHLAGVLGGDGRHHRGPPDPEGGKGLEVGLDPGTSPGVGTGDRQGGWGSTGTHSLKWEG